jgi:hypothetical protein
MFVTTLCNVTEHSPISFTRMAYIETELAKRRGQSGVDSSDKADEDKPFDPQAELFQIAEKYRIEKKRTVDEEEGNVTTSLGMLTSIPEVDLGME